MSKYRYETKDGSKTGFVPGIGEIIDGIIVAERIIENPNLILVSESTAEPTPAPVSGTASQQNPNQPATADAPTNTGVQE